MLVSRNALQSWPNLQGENNPYYFITRVARDQYFSGTTPTKNLYVAIGGDPNSTDWSEETWEVDKFDGNNWATVELDKNFALIITNEGILALTDAAAGEYKFEISRIAIKQTSISRGTDVTNWTHQDWKNSNGYSDICLDTYNAGNTSFTISKNLTYRSNLLNGGIQFTVELLQDCMGQQLNNEATDAAPTLLNFNVAAIALYVKDQRSETAEDILFAIANLPTTVEKVASAPDQVGNSLKFYLNTTLSNLGNVLNLQTINSSVNSVPEVATEDDLVNMFDTGITAPYNLYLVDNYNNTNIPAIATRKGNPSSTTYPVDWTYFTPSDDTLHVNQNLLDDSVESYMIVAWDGEKYIPADSKNNDIQSGLYTNNYLIYAGKITNTNLDYTYRFEPLNSGATGYKVGDVLQCIVDGVTFTITVIAIEPTVGKPIQFHLTPNQGNTELVNGTDVEVVYASASTEHTGVGLRANITSNKINHVTWNFVNWVNKPLYVDYDHSADTTAEWNAYCTAAQLSPTTNKKRQGLLTPVQNQYTSTHFVGWCMNGNTIKLALDLRNEATFVTYGTTRYATEKELRRVEAEAKAVTSVTPQQLHNNYLQTTLYNNTDYTTQVAADAGISKTNRIDVNTHVTFKQAIVGSNVNITNPSGANYINPNNITNNISFYGTAYNALWADLAEYYEADKVYPAGTLICIGDGLKEITIAQTECNGIISTKPGYQLGEKRTDYDLPVALVGKVPVLFANDCMPQFGDRIYLSKTEPGKASTIPFGNCLGKIIDKDKNLDQKQLIMCSVRINF